MSNEPNEITQTEAYKSLKLTMTNTAMHLATREEAGLKLITLLEKNYYNNESELRTALVRTFQNIQNVPDEVKYQSKVRYFKKQSIDAILKDNEWGILVDRLAETKDFEALYLLASSDKVLVFFNEYRRGGQGDAGEYEMHKLNPGEEKWANDTIYRILEKTGGGRYIQKQNYYTRSIYDVPEETREKIKNGNLAEKAAGEGLRAAWDTYTASSESEAYKRLLDYLGKVVDCSEVSESIKRIAGEMTTQSRVIKEEKESLPIDPGEGFHPFKQKRLNNAKENLKNRVAEATKAIFSNKLTA